MRQSQLFSKTRKEAPKDETSLNAQILIKAGFVDKLMAGVYTILPLGWKVLHKIEKIIREEMENIGGQEIFMPSLHPKENWEKTGRWETIDVLFKFKSFYTKNDYVLAGTHEEAVVPLAGKFVSSYKDLPFAVFQIQNKFRDEKRAKSGILRGREFLMKDLYSFHADEVDLDKYYSQIIMPAYKKIFDRCGIGNKTYLTYASGGTFSKYSHEYQTLTEAGEDVVYICDACKIAINKEIIQDQQGCCPECGTKELREEKAVEVGNIFKLKTKFSDSFGLNYVNQQGEKHSVFMGCYGIGLQRLMGTIVEIRGDEQGMSWPEEVAPFKVHLISIRQNEEAEKIYKKLIESGVEVLYDDREETSPGEKFKDADLIGCPYRVVVSEKTLSVKSVEIKKRSEDKVELIQVDKLISYLE